MADYYFQFDGEVDHSTLWSYDRHPESHDECLLLETGAVDCASSISIGNVASILPAAYSLPAKDFSGRLETSAYGPSMYSGSDFTTSPTSTTTQGTYGTPYEKHNPFEASFRQPKSSESQQSRLTDSSSSQHSKQPKHSLELQWRSQPLAQTFELGIIPLSTEIFYAPQPMSNYIGDPQQGNVVRMLESRAISFESARKRRKTTEKRIKKTFKTFSTDHPMRGKGIASSTQDHSTLMLERSSASVDNYKESRLIDSERRDNLPYRLDNAGGRGTRAQDKERHKHVEMKYRQQMKDRFSELLASLPQQGPSMEMDGKPGAVLQKRFRRGNILDMAKEHIDLLERQHEMLEREQLSLQGEIRVYQDAGWANARMGGNMWS